MGVTLLPPSCSAQVGLSLDWTSSSRSSGHPEKPIVFVHVDDLKLCPGQQDISWVPGVPTAKSLWASTVAFRPGSHVSDTTPHPSVDVSGWEDMTDLNTSNKRFGQTHWYHRTCPITVSSAQPRLSGLQISFYCPPDVLPLRHSQQPEDVRHWYMEVVQTSYWLSHA